MTKVKVKAKAKVIVIEKWEWLCTESEGESESEGRDRSRWRQRAGLREDGGAGGSWREEFGGVARSLRSSSTTGGTRRTPRATSTGSSCLCLYLRLCLRVRLPLERHVDPCVRRLQHCRQTQLTLRYQNDRWLCETAQLLRLCQKSDSTEDSSSPLK